MKKIGIFLLSLLLLEAAYAEQRLSSIRPGVSCDKITDIEIHLGSTESAVRDSKAHSKYTGTLGGRKASIVYHCEQGLLTEQRIIINSASQEEAYRFANEQKLEISKRLGKPIHDGLELGTWRRILFGVLGADLDYLTSVVVWGRAKEDVMLLVRETAANQWEVSISQGSSKMEYILNS